MTNYAGIDYGSGLSNIDLKTGIRFGVISASKVGQAWYENSEAEYGKPMCPHCFNDLDEAKEYWIDEGFEYYCAYCDKGVDDTEDIWRDDPLGFYYNEDGYQCEQSDDTDIFIIKSPYFTYAQFCSPCAPGAVHLENPLKDGKYKSNRGYCFGHNWFEGGVAPYPVYSVKTGKLVNS